MTAAMDEKAKLSTSDGHGVSENDLFVVLLDKIASPPQR
jgi:hypothetical protein